MSPTALRIAAVIRRHWIVLQRSPHRWFEISFWPVMDVVLWGALGVFVARSNATSQASTPYLLAGITMFWVFTQAQFAIALGVNEETWTRNILNVFTTPVREVEYIAGIALFGLVKLALCLGVLTVTTLTLFGFSLADIGWSAIPIMLLLIINGWSLGLVAVGLVLRYGQSAEILIWGLNYVLLAVSGVMFPIDAIPPGFRQVATVLPTSRLFAAVRKTVDGQPISWGSLVIALIASLVMLAASTALVTHLLAVFRRRGFVTRYS